MFYFCPYQKDLPKIIQCYPWHRQDSNQACQESRALPIARPHTAFLKEDSSMQDYGVSEGLLTLQRDN